MDALGRALRARLNASRHPGDPPPAERPAHLGRSLQESEMRPRRGVYGTGTGVRAQIWRAYSRMVRSLENLPTRAVLRIAIFAHLD